MVRFTIVKSPLYFVRWSTTSCALTLALCLKKDLKQKQKLVNSYITSVDIVVMNIQDGKECQELSLGNLIANISEPHKFLSAKSNSVCMTCHPSHPKLLRWIFRS